MPEALAVPKQNELTVHERAIDALCALARDGDGGAYDALANIAEGLGDLSPESRIRAAMGILLS